ncbi:metallophosphoesterase family protein [Candidatus Pseudoscillospira sp. SGI.172]|uniref:metallophosphoesterase family protein n=1 Tax=Candidatus Pseudoscillospira sp. SGI.172 TaxID=3420582 RepID=UPI003D0266C3
MLHILHAADLHLDAPFAALTADQARQRRAEQRLLLEKLADTASERGADLVLLSGDLLDDRQTYRETAQALAAALGRIPAPVLIAPGNHDFYQASSLYSAPIWPENVRIFREGAVRSVELPGCTVYGCAFTGPARDDSPLAGFRAPDTGKPGIMVLHADVEGTGRYASISREEIAASGLTYLALGHIHACSGLQRAGDTYWAYPGCPEGRGFDEPGDKGALWVTVDGPAVTAEFLPLCARRYEVLTCDLTGKAPVQAVADSLAPGSREDICRLILTGESDAPDLAALTRTAAPLRWSVTLRDRTRVPRDLWAREREDSLTGLFLRDMRRRIDAAGDDGERSVLEQAVRFGLAALENGEDTP